MAGLGHQDQFAPLRLSACYWFGELTFRFRLVLWIFVIRRLDRLRLWGWRETVLRGQAADLPGRNEWPLTALCSRRLNTRRMGEDALMLVD